MDRKIINKVALFLSVSIIASNLYSLPSSVIEQIDPGRTIEEYTYELKLPSLLEPTIIKLPTKAQPKIKLGTKEVKFTLGGIKFTDKTIIDEAQLKNLYIRQIGQQVSLTDLNNIVQAITAYYRNAGFVLTQAILPPQEINNHGIVAIQIIDGYVDKVIISNNKIIAKNKKLLNEYGNRIMQSKPLRMTVLEKFSLLANDIPGLNVKTVLSASPSTPGAANLEFVVTEKIHGWYVGANNFNSQLLGNNQILTGIYSNGIFAGSQTGINGAISTESNRFLYVGFQHQQPIDDNGTSIDFSINNTKTKPNYDRIDLANLNTPGEAFLLTANAYYTYTRSRAKNLSFGVGFNLLNSNTKTQNTMLFEDNIRSINFTSHYDFVDRFNSNNAIILSLVQGLEIFDAKASPPSRPGGKLDFTKITLSFNHYQNLQKNKLYYLFSLKSQYSFNQLLSSEKIGFGGPPFGYGYDPSVIVGDSGIDLLLELQYNYNFKKYAWLPLQFVVFGDYGTMWNINKTIQAGHIDAASAGGGIRTNFYDKHLSIELLLAKPFNKNITINNTNNLKTLFNVWYRV